jgi:hypothetical protein
MNNLKNRILRLEAKILKAPRSFAVVIREIGESEEDALNRVKQEHPIATEFLKVQFINPQDINL